MQSAIIFLMTVILITNQFILNNKTFFHIFLLLVLLSNIYTHSSKINLSTKFILKSCNFSFSSRCTVATQKKFLTKRHFIVSKIIIGFKFQRILSEIIKY